MCILTSRWNPVREFPCASAWTFVHSSDSDAALVFHRPKKNHICRADAGRRDVPQHPAQLGALPRRQLSPPGLLQEPREFLTLLFVVFHGGIRSHGLVRDVLEGLPLVRQPCLERRFPRGGRRPFADGAAARVRPRARRGVPEAIVVAAALRQRRAVGVAHLAREVHQKMPHGLMIGRANARPPIQASPWRPSCPSCCGSRS